MKTTRLTPTCTSYRRTTKPSRLFQNSIYTMLYCPMHFIGCGSRRSSAATSVGSRTTVEYKPMPPELPQLPHSMDRTSLHRQRQGSYRQSLIDSVDRGSDQRPRISVGIHLVHNKLECPSISSILAFNPCSRSLHRTTSIVLYLQGVTISPTGGAFANWHFKSRIEIPKTWLCDGAIA